MSRPAGKAKTDRVPRHRPPQGSPCYKHCSWQKSWLTSLALQKPGEVEKGKQRESKPGCQATPFHPDHTGLQVELLTHIPLPKLEESLCPSEGPCLSLLRPGDHPAGPHLSRPVPPKNHTLPRHSGQPAPAPKPRVPGPYPRSPRPGRAPAAEGDSARTHRRLCPWPRRSSAEGAQ